MKKRLLITIILYLSIIMISWGKNEHLYNMTSKETKDYLSITYNDKTYVPFCAIENSARGKQIAIVDNDENNQIYEYKGHSTDEWIISFYYSGEMDSSMLMREIKVKNIPKGLHSEYKIPLS